MKQPALLTSAGNYVKAHKTEFQLLFFALVTRLACLPFAQNVEADATSRVFIAEELNENFRLISSGHWPSLHFYFLSLSIWIFQDRILGPEIFSILFGAAAVVPFYKFTANLFSAKGALFASVLFTICPVVFRNSFIPLSEIYFLFFTTTALYYLSRVFTQIENTTRNSIYAGVCLTLAAGMRIEAWMLIPLLSLPLLLEKMFVPFFWFGMFASLFPVFWMVGNYAEYGDALYSIHSVENWNFNVEGHNEGVDLTEKIRRIFYFPFAWFISLTPIGFILFLYIATRFSVKKLFTRIQIWFLLIFVLLFIYYLTQCYSGRIFMQYRFTITLVLFSIPFLSLLFVTEKPSKAKRIVAVSAVALIIPFSFYWHVLPYHKLFSWNERLENCFGLVVADCYNNTTAVPALVDNEPDEIIMAMKRHHKKGDGVVLDFSSWEETYYMAQGSPFHRNEMYILPGGKNQQLVATEINSQFKNFPKGMIFLKDYTAFEQSLQVNGNTVLLNDSVNVALTPLYSENHYHLFRYAVTNTPDTVHTKPIYSKTKDAAHFESVIRKSPEWLWGIMRGAIQSFKSVETEIQNNAKFMESLEKMAGTTLKACTP